MQHVREKTERDAQWWGAYEWAMRQNLEGGTWYASSGVGTSVPPGFTKVSTPRLATDGKGIVVTWADFDRDGFPELIEAKNGHEAAVVSDDLNDKFVATRVVKNTNKKVSKNPMKPNQIRNGAAALLLCLSGETVSAAPVVDVIQANTGYFVPDDSLKYAAPYYRWAHEDWGWTHNGIAGSTFTSASLSVSAFDVDRSSGEVDVILRGVNGSGVNIGTLQGGNDIWSYTTFNLNVSDPAVIAAINSGFQVFIDIDSRNGGWAVTLAKSVLEVNGGTLPPPEPGGVPDGGGTLVIVGMASLVLGCLKKRLG